MPIYEYRCSKCGETFEAIQRVIDNPLTGCRFCKGTVERLISQSSFQLKGSGWYLTDYSRKSSPQEKASESPTKPSESAPKSSASTPKPEKSSS